MYNVQLTIYMLLDKIIKFLKEAYCELCIVDIQIFDNNKNLS